jgi:hypothetical protein
VDLRYATWFENSVLADAAQIDCLPDTVQQWKIDFDIVLDGWVIGTDHGLLWTDDQSFYVLARNTSFAIPGHRYRFKTKPIYLRPLERQFHLQITTGQSPPLSLQFYLASATPTAAVKEEL